MCSFPEIVSLSYEEWVEKSYFCLQSVFGNFPVLDMIILNSRDFRIVKIRSLEGVRQKITNLLVLLEVQFIIPSLFKSEYPHALELNSEAKKPTIYRAESLWVQSKGTHCILIISFLLNFFFLTVPQMTLWMKEQFLFQRKSHRGCHLI